MSGHAEVLHVEPSSEALPLALPSLRTVVRVVRAHLKSGSVNASTEGRQHGTIPSKERISGLGSKACCAAPDLRFTGIALSVRVSIKSLTIKSLLEKVSSVKLGAFGNIDLPLPDVPAISVAEWRRSASALC